MTSNAGRNASSRPYAIGSPHANVGEPFSWQRTINDTIAVYDEVLADPVSF
jgi:hypothetical protein